MTLKSFRTGLGRVKAGALVIALAGGCPLAALAAEGGITHVLPGSAATLIDLLPTKPGWVAAGAYLNYQGNTSAEKLLPIAGSVAAGLDATSNAVLAGGFYTFEPKVLGAHYSVGAFLPYVSVDVSASLNTTAGAIRRNDSASGLGDVTLIPVMLAWKDESSWQYNALLPIYAPTGQYEQGRLANPGLNYWTFDPTIGASYNNPKTGLNAAVYAGIGFNTENNTTNYKSGTLMHVDASVQQLLPVGPGFLGIGAEAFYIDQISGDSGGNALLGDFKSRTAGLGPVLTYILPRGKETLVAELRWLHEMNVKNRLEGDYIWLKLVYQF
jgi:hypothetical protein